MNRRLTALAVAVALCCTLALANGAAAFIGVNYGPFHEPGQAPGSPISDAQYIADLGKMAQKFGVIKTYGLDTASRLDQVVPLAHQHVPQLKIYLGVFEDGLNHSSVTQPQLDTAVSQANSYPNVSCIVVGNECLPGDNTDRPVSIAQLTADLQYVKSRLTNPQVLVTTGLSWRGATQKDAGNQTDGEKLAPYCDVITINIYPFYGGVPITGAWQNLLNAYKGFVTQYAGKPIVVGETGWPSAPPDSPSGSAVPGIVNEWTCIRQILANAGQIGNTFLFEAFDEPWKTENVWAPHWGLRNGDGSPKFSLVAPPGSLYLLMLE